MQSITLSRRTQAVLGALIVLILLCLSFLAGVKATERRIRHYSNWSKSYPDMMRPHRAGRMAVPFPERAPLPLPNGVFGRVLSVTSTNLIIDGQDNFEQNVLVTSSTAIRTEQGTATLKDIQPNMEVSVFGAPNAQGQIEARLIRLFPSR